MTMLNRWIIFNTITAFIVAYLVYFHNAVGYVLATDTTYVTSVIMAVYAIATLYYGYITLGQTEDYSEWWTDFSLRQRAVSWFTEIFMGLGIGGTVLGLMQAFGALAGFKEGQVVQLIQHFGEVAGTAPICTVFGVGAAMLLSAQLAFVGKQYG